MTTPTPAGRRSRVTAWLAYSRKALVAVAGLAADLAATGALHGAAEQAAVAVVSFAAALGVYVTPNGPRP